MCKKSIIINTLFWEDLPEEIESLLLELLPIVSCYCINRELVLVVKSEDISSVLRFLKNDIRFQFNVLSCISGVDRMNTEYRFGVVYELLSTVYNSRIRIRLVVNESMFLQTAIPIYRNADWWEREVWDFYGIYFQNHPDLRRILTDYGFEGYPMRKDFPLSGYVEVRYDLMKKRVVVEPLQLTQEYRSYNFDNSW
jgi:NADH/F420H2 dehydrogenase subunit C